MQSSAFPSGPNPFTPFILGGVRVDPELNAVIRNGRTIILEPQVMCLLLHLSERVDSTCRREAIMEAVWPDSEPNEEALTQAVSKLRKALGDGDRTMITTVRKVGYRLNGPVTSVALSPDEDLASSKDEPASTAGDVHGPKEARLNRKSRLAPSRWIWKAAAVVLVGFAISRFKVIAVHHDGAEGPRMVAVRMMDDGTLLRSHAIAINPDSIDGEALSWTARKSFALPLEEGVLLEHSVQISEELELDSQNSSD